MTRDPLSDALRTAAARYEASYSKAGAHADPTLGSRARRRRLATITAISTLSLGLVAFSGAAVGYVLRSGPDTSTDPAAIPIPEGYERIVIPLDENLGVERPVPPLNSFFEEAGFGGSLCGQPLPILDDPGPFRLEVTSVDPAYSGNPPAEGEWIPSEIFVNTTLTYSGMSGGAVETYGGAWALLRDDGTVVSSTWGGPMGIETFGPLTIYSLEKPFSATLAGPVFLQDCEIAYNLEYDPSNPPDEVMLNPGTYSIVAVVEVEWSALGTVLLNADEIGLDSSWFSMGWRDAVPCTKALAEAERVRDGRPVECVPHLYYQALSALGEYAIVDVPDGFLTGPRKTWYVVSDPYPIVLPLEGEPTTP